MHVQNSDIPLATVCDTLWLNKIYSLNCCYYSVVYKKYCSQLIIFVSFSRGKDIISSLSHLTSYTSTKSNLYLANFLGTVVSEPDLYRLLTFYVPNLLSLFHCLGRTKGWVHPEARFYGEELLAPRRTPKLKVHPLLAVRDCLFSVFSVTLHIGVLSSICNLRTRRVMVMDPLIMASIS